MSEVSEYHICLRFFGTDLEPENISSLLGVQPSSSCRIGDVSQGKEGRPDRVEKTGKWLLRMPINAGESFEPQIRRMLGSMTSSLPTWRELTTKYDADIFCGVWLDSSNQGMDLSADLMTYIAERGLHLTLDIYERDIDD